MCSDTGPFPVASFEKVWGRMTPTRRISAAHRKQSKVLPYKNAALPAAKRVKDLLSRMTLREKIAQMLCVWREKPQKLVDAEGRFDLAKAKEAFKDRNGVGQVGRPSDAGKG